MAWAMGVQAHPGGPQWHDRLDQGDVTAVVAAVAAGRAVRPREAVPVLPAAQGRAGTMVRAASSPMARPSGGRA
jgi:hypothetical protein